MADPRHLLGRAAEDRVAAWLSRQGWRIVGRGVRSPSGGEVDIVALDPSGVLVALEVRARRSPRAGAALMTVDGRRIARLRRTLAAVAHDVGPHRGLRIDLVSVTPSRVLGHWLVSRVSDVG